MAGSAQLTEKADKALLAIKPFGPWEKYRALEIAVAFALSAARCGIDIRKPYKKGVHNGRRRKR